MTKLKDAPPPPLVLPIDIARALADAAWVLPCEVLYAVRTTIDDAISCAEVELHEEPGRRGNGAKRSRMQQDYALSSVLTETLVSRSCSCSRGHAADCVLGAVPDLGPEQWKVVAAYAEGWSGTPAELFTVATGVEPDDVPVDWTAWRAWSRRRHWTSVASGAQVEASFRHQEADRAEEDAEHLTRQAEDRRRRAMVARREARQLEAAARQHELALELDDPGLALYETAIHVGEAPAAALQRARRRVS